MKESRDRIPDKVLREIFPKKLEGRQFNCSTFLDALFNRAYFYQ
jgi:hypothetical protein